MSDSTINWQLLEKLVKEQPLVSAFSKVDMAEIRSMERSGYVHMSQRRVIISAAGMNALTYHRSMNNKPAQDALATVQAERDALVVALREARDSLLDIRDLSAPYDCRDNPPGFELSRIFTHAYIGLKQSEEAAKHHGMEKGKKS